MARLQRIVHPTDFSGASGPAFKKAVELAKRDGATLLILHVLPTLPVVTDAYMAATAYDEMLGAQRRQAERQMERVVKRARAAKARATGTIVDVGTAAERIVAFAKRQRADLIVMGTQGLGILARALLGSVAQRVVTHASCPVMTIRGK